MSEAAGWYPDPFFGGRERYWDGGEWTEQCRATDTKEHQASAKPRAPLNPERATPSAVAAKLERRAAGGGLATMARPEAAEAAATPSWGQRPPPQGQPATTVDDGFTPVTPAWPTDTGWTIGAGAAAATAAEATNTPTAVPPTLEPPAPPIDAVPVFDEPTDHTEEILSQTIEVPVVVHDWSRLTPDEPTLTEEALADTDVAGEPLVVPEEAEAPTFTEEVLDEAEPPAAAAGALAVEGQAAPAVEESAEEIDHHQTEPMPAPLAETDDGRVQEPAAERSAPPVKGPRPRRSRRVLVGAGVAVLLIVVIVAAASLVKGKGGGSSSGQQVADAASATIGQRYAQVSIATNVPPGQDAAAGVVSGLSGSGPFDFGASLGSLTLSGPANDGSETVVVDGSTLYVQPGTVVAELIPGKSWVSATADDLGSNGTPTGFAVAPTLFVQLVRSPTTLLQQLEAKGATAHPMGSLIYQGTPVDEYAVTLSPAAVALGQSGVPSSLQANVNTGPTEDVYVANGLIRAIVLPFDVKSNGTTAMGTLAVGFTSWGDSADIAAPAPDQVASWAQLKQTLTYTNGLK
ncbi:MAG TPA: DUF2510 domain-containing protein [Acidimicrobiales bacterium]